MCWLLDYVPIVGTVKNTLECGEALLNGDGYKASQKGTSAMIGGILDILTFGAGSTVFNFEKSGVLLATINVVGRYCAKKAVRHPRNERGRKRRKDSDDHNDRNNPSIKEPKRGHHVINRNVLRVYKYIVTTFVRDVMRDSLDNMIESSGRLSEDSTVVTLIKQPIPDRVANFIENDMTVYFQHSRDTNAVEYGERIQELRNAVVSYMEALYKGNHDDVPAVEKKFRDITEEFIAGNYFVDEDAKKEWLSQRGNTEKKFDAIHKEVINMFRRLTCLEEGMVTTWVKELWEARGH